MDKFNSLNFATTMNSNKGGKLRKTKLEDVNFNANDLNMNNLINNLNNLSNLNNLNSQSNGSLPQDLFNLTNLNNLGSLSSLTNLNNSLNNFNSNFNNNNANQQFQQTSPTSMHHHPPSNHQFNKNAITSLNSEFTSQSSMLYPNQFPSFYQQQSSSKLTLSSSNIIAPPASSSFGFSPYLTAALQHSLLNHNFLQNSLLQQHHQISPQQQQLLIQQSLNNLTNLSNLGNLNGLNGLSNLSSFKDYLQKPEFNGTLNNDYSTNHLNQFNKNLNLLNENFLNNNSSLLYPNNQLSNNDFNFILNTNTNTNTPPTSLQNQAHSKPFKKQKLEIGNKNDLKGKLKKNFDLNIDDLKEKELLDFKDNKFEELKVQTNDHNLNKKLDDDKKFSPDSSTELITINKQKSPIHLTSLTNSLNNQSPVITSTKSSSSEHSTSPDALHSSLNTSDQSSKLSMDLDKSLNKDQESEELKNKKEFIKEDKFIKEEFMKSEFIKDRFMNDEYIKEEFIKKEIEGNEEAGEINTDQEEDELSNDSMINNHKLKIDLNSSELTDDSNNESFTSKEENLTNKKSVKTEDLYSLISKKSFQPTILNFKEVSLDRMSFDEDEDDEDKSPININFKNLIDNDLNSCSDNIKDDELMNKNRKSTSKRRKDLDSSANNPWSIRRSERIFLNEALSNNSANFNLDKQNKSFKLTLKDLEEPQRILIQVDDLLYAGLATKDELTGKYCISLDDVECLKNNQIFTFEKLKAEAIIEIKPKSIDQLFENCRVCALWSAKTKYLYPGRVAKLTSGSTSSLNSTNSKKDSVLVHFDDGDKTKISLDEIRLLPQDFELKSTDTDEENSSNLNKQPDEEKKVEKLKIRLINKDDRQTTKKKKKKHSKEKHHHKKHSKEKHHHKKHSNNFEQNLDHEEINDQLNERKEDEQLEEDDEWFTTFHNIQQWTWHGLPIKKTPKNKPNKTFYNAIVRGDEIIRTNDCAVFLSAGRTSLPFIGRIVKMWENSDENMIVCVKWFYHPEETKKPPKLQDSKGALFSSEHYDDNDVQTISHRVEVLPTYKEYLAKKKEIKNHSNYESGDEDDIYYLCGVYDPGKEQIVSLKKDVPVKKIN